MLAQRLYELDRSSTQFPEQLDKLLHDKEWIEDLKLLPEDELVELIGCLNNVLDSLDSTGLPFRKGLHVLQEICSSRMIFPSTYEVSDKFSLDTVQIVAHGGFCDVYKGSLGREGVCIKRLRITTTGDQAMVKQILCKEAVVWKHLNHPNIVPFKGVTFEPLQLVSEWMPGGELREYMRDNREANLANLANILVDATGNARIVDFGLATVARDINPHISNTGGQGNTPRYTASETLKSGHHSKESDVFSFGMVMIEVFTGNVPFSDLTTATAAITSIVFGRRPERPSHPSLTDDLWALTQHCWKEKPQDRPQMDQVIKRLADQAPQTSLTRLIERPRYENSEVIQPGIPRGTKLIKKFRSAKTILEGLLASARKPSRCVRPKPKQQPGTSLWAKLIKKIRSGKRTPAIPVDPGKSHNVVEISSEAENKPSQEFINKL
ncbi:kinase-like protein, partial [Thelephora ganbajun]